ncbi:peptidoglycan bridge formation glycyltransferase FemA/FemB family protein [Candidatus Gracilibacteria bacterium]|nr:peptidoglycan bridge formation glycyltransferase FemA/FemB family protein [Candidatus Gracilibacteria bacterium]
MNFTLKKISPSQLDGFYNEFEGEKSYLQTSTYGDFREAVGEKNFRYGIFFGDMMIGIVQFQRIPARRGTHLHTPHGPLIASQHQEPALKFFLQEYKKIGKKEQCDFVRVSPLLSPDKRSMFRDTKYRPSPVHLVNPERTWVLDLTQSEEDMLKNMRKSMRYEVRRIEKCGIKVQMGNTKKDLDIFWKLHTETVARQGFVPFALSTTEKELEAFGQNIQIFSASLEQEMCSSSIVIFDKHSGYYHQGASIYRKEPVAHATLWSAIQEAKKRGCREFNFWGVSPEENLKHPWTGLSRFKRGFGGEERVFLHAQDAPLTPKYWLNWTIEKYRKWKRRY